MELREGFERVVQGVVKECNLKEGVTNEFVPGFHGVIDIEPITIRSKYSLLRLQYR